MEPIFQFLQLHPNYFYVALPVLFCAAGCLLPVSEELVIVFSAYLAAHVTKSWVPIFIVIYFSAVVLGDCLPYCLGRFLFLRISFIRKFLEKRIKLIRFFDKNAKKALFLGRFVPVGVRGTILIYSGFRKIPMKTFLKIDCFAVLLFISFWFFPVYFLGLHWDQISHSVQNFVKIGSATVILALFSVLIFRKKQKKTIGSEEC